MIGRVERAKREKHKKNRERKIYLALGLLLFVCLLPALSASVRLSASDDLNGPEPIVPGAPKPAGAPPQSVVTLYNQAKTLVQRGQNQNAQALVEEGLRLDSAYFPLWNLKAQIALKQGRFDEADEAVRVLLEKNPQDTQAKIMAIDSAVQNPALSNEAKAARLNGEFKGMSKGTLSSVMYSFLESPGARDKLPRLLAAWKASDLGMPAAWKALDQYAKGNIKEAEGALTASSPEDLPPSPLLGAIYYSIGKNAADRGGDKNAIQLLENAQKGGYPAERVANEVGAVHLRNKRYKEAADIWESRWRDAPDPENWIVRIADARFQAGEVDRAAEILNQGLAVFPKSAVIQGKYLYALHLQKKPEEQESFELRLDGLNAQVGLSYGRALVYKDENETAKARSEMERAIQYAEASTGQKYQGNDLEEWLASMAGTGGASAASNQEALRLRDRGWNYWQEREYRKAYEVWEEAIAIGFPQVRLFIMNITTRLLEVGMMREANQLMAKHLPEVSPFSFAYLQGQANRWDAVSALLRSSPQDRYAPWSTIYATYAALRMGRNADLERGMNALAKATPPAKSLSVVGLDDQARIVTYTLTPAHYGKMVSALGREAIRQKNPLLLLRILNSPQGSAIVAKERTEMFAAATQEVVRQGDQRAIDLVMTNPEWANISEGARLLFVEGATREVLRQKNIGAFLDFLALAQWKQLPASTRNGIVKAAGDAILEMQMTDLFPLFLENQNWRELPAGSRYALLVGAGKLLYRYGYDDTALPYFTEAASVDASKGTSYAYLSLIEKKRGNDERAREYLARAHSGDLGDADRAYVQAMTALLDQDGAAAAEHFLAYLKYVPDDHLAKYQAINLLVSQNRFMEARVLKDSLEEVFMGGNGEVSTYVALLRQRFGNPEEAEPIWSTLYSQFPERLDHIANLGVSLNEQGKFELAMDILAEPARESGDIRVLTPLAQAAFSLALYEETLEWVDFGLSKNPGNQGLLRFGAESAEALGNFALAERYAGHFIALQPDTSSQQGVYLRSLLQQKKLPEVHSHDKTLLASNRMNESALYAESEYAKAMVAKYQDSIKRHPYLRLDRRVTRKTLDYFPQDPTSWSKYAIAAAGDSYFHGAIPAMKHLYEMGPNQAMAIIRYPRVSNVFVENTIPLFRVREQIEIFLKGGHTFARLKDIPKIAEKNRSKEKGVPVPILLVFNPMDRETLASVDAMLKEYGITAALTLTEASLHPETPIWPDVAELQKYVKTGRWTFLLTDDKPAYWGGAKIVDGQLETEEQMYKRWRGEMERLKAVAQKSGIKVAGWVFPGNDYGQLRLEQNPEANDAYRRATQDVFGLGFASNSAGFWAPHEDLWRVPMRTVYLGTDTLSLARSLEKSQPTRVAVLDFAKILSWHGQHVRADKLFAQAEREGLDLKEIYYFQARNAQYQSDVPTMRELARKNEAVDPYSERTAKLNRDADKQMRPLVAVRPRHSWDSDGRKATTIETRYSQYVNEKTMVYGGVDASKYETDGLPSIQGVTPKIGVRVHTKPGHWVEGELGVTTFNRDGNAAPNAALRYHGSVYNEKLGNLNGTYDLAYNYGPVETVEAIGKNIGRHHITAETSLRVNDFWDVDASAYASHYTDDNQAVGARARVLYRFSDKPAIRGGYLFEVGDSKKKVDEYYTPKDYMHHSLVVDYRQEIADKVTLNLGGSYGVARSEGRDWEPVWRANGTVNWKIGEDTTLSLGYNHMELPDYSYDEVRGGIEHRF